MGATSNLPRIAGRVVGGALIGRTMSRYPIIGIGLALFRWWRRRRHRVDRTSVRLRDGETITIRQRRA